MKFIKGNLILTSEILSHLGMCSRTSKAEKLETESFLNGKLLVRSNT
jgi:hypothetical protein